MYSAPPPEAPAESKKVEAEDLTGRRRMLKNVVASWGGHAVFVVAGFILPRLVDRHIGQAQLGIWDFAWTLVSYYELAQAGMGQSSNRFVAEHRAAGDTPGLLWTVASTQVVQIASAIGAALFTLAAVLLIPRFPERFGAHVEEAQWVVGLLGSGVTVQMCANAYSGVITGCHRWDVHNGINSGFHALTVTSMVVALTSGGGLRALATASLCGTTAAEITRVIAAYRVCPELRMDLRLATLAGVRRILGFGGRTVMGSLSRLLLYQTNNMMILAHFGPAMLALYARPVALFKHTQTIIDKFSFVLIPTASSLLKTGSSDELRALVLRMGRYGAQIAIPMVLFIGILGTHVLRLWMGPAYEQGAVVAILAAGHVFALTQQPLYNVLIGLDMHWTAGLARLLGAIASVGIGWVCMGPLGLGIAGAAIALATPLALVHGCFVPWYACSRLGITVRRYVVETLGEPILLGAPFAAALAVVRIAFAGRPLAAILAGFGCCAVLAGVLAYRYRNLLPARQKRASAPTVEPSAGGVGEGFPLPGSKPVRTPLARVLS